MKTELSYPSEAYDVAFELEDNSFWYQHRKRILETLLVTLNKESKILDVGGGNGYLTKFLQDKGADVTLLEPSPIGCANAKLRGVLKVQCGTLDEIPDESIEIAICCDVLEHIEQDFEFLALLFRKLKPSSRLVLMVPSHKFLWSYEDELAGHFRRYSQLELEKLLKSAGFHIKFSTFFFSFLVLPIYFFRVLLARKHKRTSKAEFKIKNREHVNTGIIKYILGMISNLEIQLIKRKKSIHFGSSLLVECVK
jgi:SAM-dependent methyltransferase